MACNVEALAAAGLAVAKVSPSAVAGELAAAQPARTHGPAWRKTVHQLTRSGCPVALFSAEGLCNLPAHRAMATIQAFGSLAERVDVMLYLRHPVHFANSAVSQRLRNGSTLERVFAQPPVLPLSAICRTWEAALAASNVPGSLIVRPYLRDVDPRWTLIDDILGVCCLAPSAAPVAAVEANRGFSVLAAHALDWVNRQSRPARLHPSSLRAFGLLEGPRFAIPDAVCLTVRETMDGALNELACNYGVRLAEGPHTPSQPPGLSDDELASVARTLLLLSQYSFEVEHSRIGRWFGLWPPVHTRPARDPLYKVLAKFGLVRLIGGSSGARVRTIRRRVLPEPGVMIDNEHKSGLPPSE